MVVVRDDIGKKALVYYCFNELIAVYSTVGRLKYKHKVNYVKCTV